MATNIPGDYRLTIGQRFFAHRFEMWPNSSRPNQRLYRLVDNFKYSAFVTAMQYTIDSHPGLRIRLFRDKEEWRQFFPEQKANVSGDVLDGSKPEQCLTYGKKVILEEAYRPMDLKYENPVRVKVLNVNGQYWLSICADHMAIDEVAFNLLERELLIAYQNVINDVALADLSQDVYVKYLLKEENRKPSEERNLHYWQEQLKEAPMLIDAAKSGMVPAGYYIYQLKGEQYEHLLEFCKRSKFSLFNVLTAVQLMLMAEKSGNYDLVISFVIANRFTPEEQNLIINLVMLLHVRFVFDPNESLMDFLLRVKETSLTALIHRNYDYASLYRVMAAEAREKGCFPNLGRECNLIVDEEPMQFPNDLFLERMEEKSKGNYQTMKASFSIYAEQTPQKLEVKVTWDCEAWGISNDEMRERFPHVIQQFMNQTVEVIH